METPNFINREKMATEDKHDEATINGNTSAGVILEPRASYKLPKRRDFQLTINNIETYDKTLEYLLNLKSLSYIIACEELAPTTNKKHIHIYTHFKNAISLSIKKCNKAHIEVCKGSPKQNIDYIRKNGNIIFEDGEEPKQGNKNYNYENLKMTTEKDILNNEELNNFEKCAVLKLKKIADNEPMKASDFLNSWSKFDELKVYYICGPSGSGKSQKAKEIIKEYVQEKPEANIDLIKYTNNFYIGATGKSEIGFYDEFRPSHMKASEFINLIDYNKHQMNIKGGNVKNNYKMIIITSIFKPEKIYNNIPDESKTQWLRRMNIINLYKDEEELIIDEF